MRGMAEGKIIITHEDLHSRRVENRLREQQAIARNRLYASLEEDALPVATTKPTRFWHGSAFIMAAFGLLGGLLAWCASLGFAALLSHGGGKLIGYRPTAKADALALVKALNDIQVAQDASRYSPEQAKLAADEVRASGRENPYFAVATDSRLSDAQREVKVGELDDSARYGAFLVEVLRYGICGLMIAMCLAIAEPLSQRKFGQATRVGAVGAILGLIGGVIATLLAGRIAIWAGSIFTHGSISLRQMASDSAVWAALGLSLGLASGLVMRNWKKLGIGLLGGLVGGAIGGALLGPMQRWTHDPQIARLVALVVIGVVAGASTGLIEHATRSGWLKVTTGIIAGKQFIVYRNPTYIGSSPDCQIYLFKDPKVGKRHAAVHITPAGIELENLPLGISTMVNGRAIDRVPLKNGDRIAIGATQFVFQEKRPTAAR